MLRFLVEGLAVYRVAHMLSRETGPFGLFERFRFWAAEKEPPVWLDEGLSCPVCQSFWLGLLYGLAARRGLPYALALGSVALLAEKHVEALRPMYQVRYENPSPPIGADL